MFSKWTNNGAVAPAAAAPQGDMGNGLGEQFVVLLLYGKNSFGDKLYSYLKIMLSDLQKLKAAMAKGLPFSPSDFGTILAAGRDEPTDEVRAEMASICPVIDPKMLPANYMHQYNPNALANLPKKNWDEY